MNLSIAGDEDALLIQASAALSAGDVGRAESLLSTCLLTASRGAKALHLLGAVKAASGRLPEAIACFGEALSIEPGSAEILASRGVALAALGQHEAALASLRTAAQLRPAFAAVWERIAASESALGRHEDALAALLEARNLEPAAASLTVALGQTLRRLGRVQDAAAVLRAHLESSAHDPAAAELLAEVLAELGQLGEAARVVEAVVRLDRDRGSAWLLLGTLRLRLGLHAQAVECFDSAAALQPSSGAAHSRRGVALQALGRVDEAYASYTRAAKFPESRMAALSNRADLLLSVKRFPEARADLEALLRADPNRRYAAGMLFRAKSECCDWTDRDRACTELRTRALAGAPVSEPFTLLAATDSAEAQLQAAQRWCRELYGSGTASVDFAHPADRPKLRVAYVSADFAAHATAYLITELFETHDRDAFEVIGVALNRSDGSPQRRRLEHACDQFVEASGVSDEELARHLRESGTDIAVDLKGLTTGARPRIFQQRAAPIQVSFLGYPGSSGSTFLDYLIADAVVIPPESRRFFSESIAYLPHSYQVNDSRRPRPLARPARARVGLPDSGFVFACFNQSYKITPDVFEIWMRLLCNVEGSVLWLLASNPYAPENLARAAVAHGVAGERLVFADPIPLAAHLERLAAADLCLDTLPVNSHTTASDALWVGVPLVTCVGQSFAARVAASVLTAAGLPQLITTTLADYEALAFRIATEPALQASLRGHLEQQRSKSALFDCRRYARHLEDAYRAMWDRYRRGHTPATFIVAERPG